MSVGYYTFAAIAQPHTNYLNLKKNAPSQKVFLSSNREKKISPKLYPQC